MKKIKFEITKEKNIYLVEHLNKTLSIHKTKYGVILYLLKKLKNLEETKYGT